MRVLAGVLFAGILLAQRKPVDDAWDLVIKGRRPEAARMLREIIRGNPGDADARLLLGSVLQEAGDRAGSLEQLSEAVRLRPRSAEAQNALGEALHTFGENKAARGPFTKAVALDPNFAEARVNLSLILVDAGEFEAAAPLLDRALEIFGNKPDAAYPHYLRAKVWSAEGDAAKAVAHLEAAVVLRPDFVEAWSDLGDARNRLGEDSAALAALQRAVVLAPDDAVAQTRLGAKYLEEGNAKVAADHLQEAARLDPKNQSTLYSLQRALREAGRPEQADAVKKQLAELLIEKDRAEQTFLSAIQLNNQGADLEKAGNLQGALEKYRAARALLPQHTGIRANYAIALLRLGQWKKGLAELREVSRLEPQNALFKAALEDAVSQAPMEFGGLGKPAKRLTPATRY